MYVGDSLKLIHESIEVDGFMLPLDSGQDGMVNPFRCVQQHRQYFGILCQPVRTVFLISPADFGVDFGHQLMDSTTRVTRLHLNTERLVLLGAYLFFLA